MSFLVSPHRRVLILRACASLLLAISLSLLPLIYNDPIDLFGNIFLYSMIGLCVLSGILNIWWARNTSRTEKITLFPQHTSISEQIRIYQRMFWLSSVALPAMTVWLFVDLYRLEMGLMERVSVWAPIALVYEFLGFWPAIGTMLFLSIACPIIFLRKLRQVRLIHSVNQSQLSQNTLESP